MLLLLCGVASAQSRVDIGTAISGSRNFGSENPRIDIVGHVVGTRGRFGFEGGFSYGLLARKTQTHDGRSAEGSAVIRYYAARVFVAGGARAGYQSTSLYSKSDGGPVVGGGYDDGTNVAQILYDHSFGENRSDGLTLTGERVLKTTERTFLSVRPFVIVARFNTPHAFDGVDRRLTGARAGIAVGFGWR